MTQRAIGFYEVVRSSLPIRRTSPQQLSSRRAAEKDDI